MISGHPCHPSHFQTELQNEFNDRFVSLAPSPDNESLRDILHSIFLRCEATVESLLGHPFFQSVELVHSPQRIKLQSAEKGLVKNAMAKSEELRAQRREALVSRVEAVKEEKEKQVKELEEAELAEEIVTKRRNKSLRRASAGSSGGGGSIRRRSLVSGQGQAQGSPTPANASPKEQPELLSSTSSPLIFADPKTSSSPPPPAPVPLSPPAASSSSTFAIPPQYQKLLNVGLPRDVVSPSCLSLSLSLTSLLLQISLPGHAQDACRWV
jgi:hypothetical protein